MSTAATVQRLTERANQAEARVEEASKLLEHIVNVRNRDGRTYSSDINDCEALLAKWKDDGNG